MDPSRKTLVLACGALAREIQALKRANGWEHLEVRYLPPQLHNHPQQIPGAIQAAIAAARKEYRSIFVAYADCGTGGRLDALLEAQGIERLSGAHCYEFYAGAYAFAALSEEEPGTFYLTDFLVRHFKRLVVQELGMDRYPELVSQYFAHYRRVVYLSQTGTPSLIERARNIALGLGLRFEHRPTGYRTLGNRLAVLKAQGGSYMG